MTDYVKDVASPGLLKVSRVTSYVVHTSSSKGSSEINHNIKI